jgi:O-6-methylguanine DNA methyltransferase
MSVTCLRVGQPTYTKDVPRPQRDLPAASYVVLPSAPWCGGRIRILYRCNCPDPTAQSGGRVRAGSRNAPAFWSSAIITAPSGWPSASSVDAKTRFPPSSDPFWKLRRKPYGEVPSYKWIAERLGRPDTALAVGNAMTGNPVPIIVPCHGAVKTDGDLGGYSFGLLRKEALLNLERGVSPYVGCASTRILCRRG